jgi:hypothetical protein
MLSTSPLSLPLPSDTNDEISDGMRSTRSFLHPSSSFQIPIEFSHLDPRFFRPIPLDLSLQSSLTYQPSPRHSHNIFYTFHSTNPQTLQSSSDDSLLNAHNSKRSISLINPSRHYSSTRSDDRSFHVIEKEFRTVYCIVVEICSGPPFLVRGRGRGEGRDVHIAWSNEAIIPSVGVVRAPNPVALAAVPIKFKLSPPVRK